jgi:hypothetical protein
MTNENYDVLDPNGFRICSLNKKLAKKQGVTKEELSALVLSHQLKYCIFTAASKTKEPKKLKMLSNMLEALEFEQQKLWHFDIDRIYHRWFDLPNCICPELDNLDRLGTKFRVYTENCPAHGK